MIIDVCDIFHLSGWVQGLRGNICVMASSWPRIKFEMIFHCCHVACFLSRYVTCGVPILQALGRTREG
jgi:hypothetical protein